MGLEDQLINSHIWSYVFYLMVGIATLLALMWIFNGLPPANEPGWKIAFIVVPLFAVVVAYGIVAVARDNHKNR